ncbi:DUF1207 domain-containing protein [Schlesneria sp. DSM 10557]|uniref:DUF1207 domain-containing protein n=1 Tax=Schlesneria sp. DSM 10557 TaxID=3044399 RepID=UPI0035A0F584
MNGQPLFRRARIRFPIPLGTSVLLLTTLCSSPFGLPTLLAQSPPPLYDPSRQAPLDEATFPERDRDGMDSSVFAENADVPSVPPSVLPSQPATEWSWKFLPQGFLYHTYWASTAEPRLSTRAVSDSGGHNSLDSQIGGRFGIVRFGNPNADEGFQLDLLGGANLRQNTDTDDWDMTGTDYRYDIPLAYRRGRHAWKFGFYHVSSHMGDEFLKFHPSVSRIDYFRNSFYLGYSYYVVPEFRLYGEIDYAVRSDFAEPLHLQVGFDWGPVRPTGVQGAPFLAVNGHLREELDYSGNVSIQAGWAWKGEGRTAGTLRTGLHYYNGGSPQYSFYRENEQQIGCGLWYDF